MSDKKYRFEKFRGLEKSQLFEEDGFLHRDHWDTYFFGLLIGITAVVGLIKFHSWQFILPLLTVPIGIYANYRTRTVTSHSGGLICVATVGVSFIGGVCLLSWAMTSQ